MRQNPSPTNYSFNSVFILAYDCMKMGIKDIENENYEVDFETGTDGKPKFKEVLGKKTELQNEHAKIVLKEVKE